MLPMPPSEMEGAPATGVNQIEYDVSSGGSVAHVLTRNVAALSCGLAILCKVLRPVHAEARQLYIDLREAMRKKGERTQATEEVYAGVMRMLLPDNDDHEITPTLATHIQRLRTFIVRRGGMCISPCDVSGLSCLRPGRSNSLYCALTRGHTLVETASSYGAYVELSWDTASMSLLECRLTTRLWSRVLGFVDANHMLIKAGAGGRIAVVLRREDYVRLLRYAPSRLHCARVISLKMPTYKMMCQNYVQANMSRDVAGAVSFAKDFVSLLSTSVPEAITSSPHSDIGMLHALLALFGDALAANTMRPLLDPNELRVCHKNDLVEQPLFGQGMHTPNDEMFYNVTDNATLVRGFVWSSENIYMSLVAFMCIREPHVIAVSSVNTLLDCLRRNLSEQPRYKAAMTVISELWGRASLPTVNIEGKPYVDVPTEMRNILPDAAPPIVYVYGFLLSDLVERKIAAKVLLTIRLSPEKTPFLSMPTPLRLAETRMEGVQGLKAMDREYSQRVPGGPFSELYDMPRVGELGCMQYFIFFLEMLTYVQGETLHCDNLAQCRREFGRYGNEPHAPLENHTFRGAVTPDHVLRNARRDMTHDPSRTMYAYELESGVFQHEVVPTVKFAAAHADQDVSRHEFGSPYVGSDSFLHECVFMIPVDRVVVPRSSSDVKRKSDACSSDPSKRPRTPSVYSWDEEVNFVMKSLGTRDVFPQYTPLREKRR